jgi:formate dehydrogenase iron-sulfur subunit
VAITLPKRAPVQCLQAMATIEKQLLHLAAPKPTGLVSSATPKPAAAPRKLPMLSVEALLETQRTLTAVERFSRKHEDGELPEQAKYYRDLIPLERPKPGEQYAFEVDLDKCTGCKACVSACHTMNGLDDDETWRTVGLLHGGTARAPAVQTVTTSCHHCVEPACMIGCPVNAYEKDPITGIVKHLDDQCFGCQYCTLMCPYDAPKFSKSRGIVRKCDMCSDRLEHAEAPACVQACPNEAIAIRIVEQAEAVQTSEAHAFLPGAPAPEHTMPTTVYKTARVLPHNMLPADFYATKPEHSHLPLVIMLTLTQLSVGAFIVGQLVEKLSGGPAGSARAQAAVATVLALVALGASMFHLGRPWLAWRAFINIRRSWFSREVVAFGAFAQLAVLYAALMTLPEFFEGGVWQLLREAAPVIQSSASVAGAIGVLFSVMVYVATQRAQWSGSRTGIKFFGTVVLLGSASVVAVWAFTRPEAAAETRLFDALLSTVAGASLLKLSYEGSLLLHARNKLQTIEKRMAHVMLTDLRVATALRFALGACGGLLLPWLLQLQAISEQALPALALVMWGLLTLGELTERYLFFRAAPASRMPGGLR